MATASVDLDNDATVDRYSEYEYDDSGIRVAQTEQVDADDNGDLNGPDDKNTRTDNLVDHRNHTGYAQVLEEILGNLDNNMSHGCNQVLLVHDVLAHLPNALIPSSVFSGRTGLSVTALRHGFLGLRYRNYLAFLPFPAGIIGASDVSHRPKTARFC
jgi:hypothetical protein